VRRTSSVFSTGQCSALPSWAEWSGGHEATFVFNSVPGSATPHPTKSTVSVRVRASQRRRIGIHPLSSVPLPTFFPFRYPSVSP